MDAKKNGSTNWTRLGRRCSERHLQDVVLTLLMRANGNGKDGLPVLSIWDGETSGMGGGTNDLFSVILVGVINNDFDIRGLA